jgi:peptidoglycan/xylan/chitin deacetylase (PgdA/CDA1 family)
LSPSSSQESSSFNRSVRFLARRTPGVLWESPTRDPVAALTFDDGPDPRHTPRALDLLSRHGAHATFFLIGAHAHAHPALVARIRAEGHEAGNHWIRNHTTLTASDEEFTEGLERTTTLIGGPPPRFFRPPGGLIRPRHRLIAAQHGLMTVLGTAHPYDPTRPPAAYMRWLIGKNLQPGGIVILHDGGAGDRSRTLAALDGVLEDADRRGLRLVTLSELLAHRVP